MKEQKVYTKRMKREYIISGATILGAILILLSISFPWFYFAGTAEYYWGSVEVSGQVYAVGIGKLDRNAAKVTMWSSSYWSTVHSDFWFGYLSVVGLILISTSILVFMKTYKPRISMLLALLGGSMAVLATVIATTYYKPYIFNITGSIYVSEYLSIQDARLYAEQAIVSIGLGTWLSLIGGLISIISMALAYYRKRTIRKKEN